MHIVTIICWGSALGVLLYFLFVNPNGPWKSSDFDYKDED